MAVIETILSFFSAAVPSSEAVMPAAEGEYTLRPLALDHLQEVLRLNIRCFQNGDNYTKHTFDYLLNEPRTLSYGVWTEREDMAAFAFVMVADNGSAHLTTIGVAPEHRRRGLALMLLEKIETALLNRSVNTLILEVRVGNEGAQKLYRGTGFNVVQRIIKYYNNGEDCFLMMKALKK
jgi:[ribosomal protein S18]-alanine N-acetyltransferase